MKPQTKDAYKLVHDGILAFARAERQGIHVDVEYCERKKAHLTRKIERTGKQLQGTKLIKLWKKIYGAKLNLGSNHQLSYILYKIMKIEPLKSTAGGKQGATDEESLSELDIPELSRILEIRKLMKVRDTYLDGFLREQVDGIMHPFANLHLARTYRSCVAVGTLVLAVRDFLEYPNGVPIEVIKKGDYVYCFDDYLQPAIRKVLWAGKTGHRKVIRVHYSVNGRGGKGYLDVTPEHEIRLINGEYEQAQNLVGDFRRLSESPHLPKIRALSCKRAGDALNFTGHLHKGRGVLESRLIYKELIDASLPEKNVIHHKNEKHLDHTPSNLEKYTLSTHSKLHSKNTICTQTAQENSKIAIQKAKLAGEYLRRARRMEEHPNYLNLTRFTCLRLLAEVKGKVSKVHYSFDVFKTYLKKHSIDSTLIKLRYDKNGKYISRARLVKLSPLGISKVENILGHNYYKLKKLYEFYELRFSRKWANQFGEFKPGNHNITKIEWINETVDVYDIEVDKCHNFIANEICVHNSMSNPNFQNIPARDKYAMKTCRQALYTRPDHHWLAVDYSGVEVFMACCYTEDQRLIHDAVHGDMHKDMAIELYMLDSLDKDHPGEKNLRQGAKNGFVFPEFYGDYSGNCAPNLLKWAKIAYLKDGTPALVHLSDKGLVKLNKKGGIISSDKFLKHVQNVEDDFWNVRYKTYTKWKDSWWRKYQKRGYIDLFTGFRCQDVMDKKQCCNTPFQGSAFHCLLWSFIRIDQIAYEEEEWDSKPIGQIHDEISIDTHPDELEHVAETVQRVSCTELPKEWDWINVPLSVDADLCEVNASWATKKPYKLPEVEET